MLLPFFAAASQLLNLDIYESNSIGNSEICQPEQCQGRKNNVIAIIVGENKRYGSIKAKWQIVGCFQTKLCDKKITCEGWPGFNQIFKESLPDFGADLVKCIQLKLFAETTWCFHLINSEGKNNQNQENRRLIEHLKHHQK